MSLLTKAKQLQDYISQSRGVVIPEDVHAAIGYDPRPLQARIASELRRFSVVVVHRRFGKTVMCITELIDAGVECPFPDGRYAYMAPTYGMAEDIAWLYLEGYVRELLKEIETDRPDKYIVPSRLSAFIPTRRGSFSRIRLYGVDSPKQRLRGLYLDGGVGDEWPHIPPSVFTEQVRPMLSDENRAGVDDTGRRNQWFIFVFTPFGRNHAYGLFRDGKLWSEGKPVMRGPEGNQSPIFRNDWYATLYRASETGVLTRQELGDALLDIGQAKYDQEYECSFDAAVEGAILARQIEELRERGRITLVPWTREMPVGTSWDLGWDAATAVWFWQFAGSDPITGVPQIKIIDYDEAVGLSLPEWAERLATKPYSYMADGMFFPHDVEHAEIGSGKTRKAILRECGVRVRTTAKPPTKADGIAAMQSLLPRCYFDESACADGLDRLSLYRREYDDNLQRFRDKPLNDWASHGADAFQTLALGLRRYRVDPSDGGGARSGSAEL